MRIDLLADIGDKPLLVEPGALRVIAARLARVAVAMGQPQAESFNQWMAARADRPPYQIDRTGAAVIPVRGLILKSVPPIWEWFGELFGWSFCGTEATRDAIARAVEDSDVDSIRLEVDSPGGTVDGVQALADDVFAARGLKRLTAVVDGLMASAALWIGSQAASIHAGPTSEIGSIGTFGVITDWSAMFEEAGVKVHVISNAPGKGHATGAPVPSEQLANFQAIVDGLTEQFVAGVARGRGMDVAAAGELATGDVWLGEEAKKKGLVDTVGPDSKAINTNARQEASSEESTMTKEEQDRIAQLEADRDRYKAEAEAQAELLKASKQRGLEAIVDKHSDRVPPSARKAVLKFGATFENEAEFETYLADLPVVTRAEPIGVDGGDVEDPSASTTRTMTAEQRKLCRIFGFKSWDRVERLGTRGTGIMSDGTVILPNASFVPPEDFEDYAAGKTQPVAAEEMGFR